MPRPIEEEPNMGHGTSRHADPWTIAHGSGSFEANEPWTSTLIVHRRLHLAVILFGCDHGSIPLSWSSDT
jgi:hypothetical protein